MYRANGRRSVRKEANQPRNSTADDRLSSRQAVWSRPGYQLGPVFQDFAGGHFRGLFRDFGALPEMGPFVVFDLADQGVAAGGAVAGFKFIVQLSGEVEISGLRSDRFNQGFRFRVESFPPKSAY